MIELLSTETKPVYIEDGSIDRKACRKLSWDFKKKYSFRIGAFRRDFLD